VICPPSTVGVKTGPFMDQRPAFAVYVTGHPNVIPSGAWAYSPLGRREFMHPGAVELRSYLDAVLWQRRGSNRVHVYCRAGRGLSAGVDDTVRAYCELRDIPCLPIGLERDTWGDEAEFRRDLELVAKSHALVWFGRREQHADRPDVVTLAIMLGVNHRVVSLRAGEEESEGQADYPN
jgi:hypothetical protein